jgi:hypothetical protein
MNAIASNRLPEGLARSGTATTIAVTELEIPVGNDVLYGTRRPERRCRRRNLAQQRQRRPSRAHACRTRVVRARSRHAALRFATETEERDAIMTPV